MNIYIGRKSVLYLNKLSFLMIYKEICPKNTLKKCKIRVNLLQKFLGELVPLDRRSCREENLKKIF